MSGHTKGPWGDQITFDGNLTIGIEYPENDERDHFLAEVTSGDPEELQANANLICASPELLEASISAYKLLDSVAFVSVSGDSIATLHLLRTAIARATGEKA